MAAFDFDSALRWARFDKGRTLARRAEAALPFASSERIAGPPLLLDSCVYIDQFRGRSPDIVELILSARLVNHSAVAVQELMHAVGVLNQKDHRTPDAIATIRHVILAMPPHRLFAPDVEILGRAALLSGILCRVQRYGADQKFRALQDCVLFLQAQRLGLTLLTANLSDFDLLLQLLPAGRVLFYRCN